MDTAPVRIIVTGDRNWNCQDLAVDVVRRLLLRYGDELVVVHGGCNGVDESFAAACDALDVAHEPHPAKWSTMGDAAGPIRNREMVEAGATLCVGFHRKLAMSKGTKNCLKLAVKAGVPTYLVASRDGRPERLREGDPRLG